MDFLDLLLGEDVVSVGEFFFKLLEMIANSLEVIKSATIELDSINFHSSLFSEYLGYAKYVMGSSLYGLFTSVCIIALGAASWTYLLKGIGYVKELLPWG